MESLEHKLRRVREAMGKLSISGNATSNSGSPVRSGRPCVTWADGELTNNSSPASPRILQRIHSFSPRHSPNFRRPQQLDNRPSPSRHRRLFYTHSLPGPSQTSPTNQSSVHGVSSSPCLRRMAHALTAQTLSLPLGPLDNRSQNCQSSPEFDTERNTRLPVSPNLAAKVLFSRPLSVNFRNDDMETFFEESDFVAQCVHWHNILRQRHQTPTIALSSELCQGAQEWANHMAHNETFYHRNPRNVGENLFTRWSCAPEFDVSGREAVFYWYSGIKQYNFNAEPDLLHVNAGQFTQMVWKSTTEIGVGKARARGGKIFVVAHYRPQGNIIGHFQENVLPPILMSDSDESSNDASGQDLSSPEASSSTSS